MERLKYLIHAQKASEHTLLFGKSMQSVKPWATDRIARILVKENHASAPLPEIAQSIVAAD